MPLQYRSAQSEFRGGVRGTGARVGEGARVSEGARPFQHTCELESPKMARPNLGPSKETIASKNPWALE